MHFSETEHATVQVGHGPQHLGRQKARPACMRSQQAGRDIPVPMARRRKPPQPPVIGDMPDEDVRRYAGQWVATKDGRALFGSLDPREVFDWLDEHEIDGVTVHRVPGKNDPRTWTYGSVRATHG